MTNSEMYKNLANKIGLIILFCMISLPAFASVNIYDLLEKEANNINPISKISSGKPIVSNLFSKNLDLIKNNEIKITNQTITKIKDFYASKNCFLKNNDIFNIIMNSNKSALYTIESVLTDKSKQNIGITPSTKVNKSYQKFFNCKKEAGEVSSYRTFQDIENEINGLYSKLIDNEYKLETKNQDNFGEDFFRNGDTEDSSFDILADIYNIGHILMQDFKEQVKLYFYNLPDNNSANSTLSFNNIISNKFAANDISGLKQNNKDTENADINNFISNTNQTEINNSSYENTNQCIDTSTEASTVKTNDTEENTDYKGFLSGVEDFIANANIDEKINLILTDNFKKETNIDTETIDNNKNEEQTQNDTNENFIDNNMVINKSCSEDCSAKETIGEQTKCELACSLSCFKKCENIDNNSEKTICKSECVCFMVSGPKKPLLSGLIEADIYKVKFCKEPITNYKIQRNKTVGSIEEIFFEMNNVFKNLRDGGEMIKNKKTKEFLEIPVELNFGKIFSFALNINWKKIPNTKQTRSLEDKKIKENKAKKSSIIDAKSDNNEKDNYNKYIIMQSIAGNNTNIQTSNSLIELINKLKEQQTILEINKTKEDSIKKSQNEKNISLTTQVETFLAENISFRKEFGTTMADANDIAYSLKDKIKSSK